MTELERGSDKVEAVNRMLPPLQRIPEWTRIDPSHHLGDVLEWVHELPRGTILLFVNEDNEVEESLWRSVMGNHVDINYPRWSGSGFGRTRSEMLSDKQMAVSLRYHQIIALHKNGEDPER